MNTGFVERIAKGGMLLDGGMGSALIDRGLVPGQCFERWSLERPDDVREIHASYLVAGSAVIQTNTFGGNAVTLGRHGLAEQAAAINRRAVEIAREAVEQACATLGTNVDAYYVAGNMGPSGLSLPPVGNADPAALEGAFAEQAAALEDGGADCISIETMVDLEEALCALRGAQRSTTLPTTVCLTYEKKPRGFFTIMGNRPDEAVRILEGAGAVAVGANCSIGSDVMAELARVLITAATVPVILKPNAGMPRIDGTRAVYDQDPRDFARNVAAMAQRGAAGVGGCCGTDHRFIAALSSALGERTGGNR
jgi:5-methyltetrahydrofolate--homocysteine methyltransferase